MESIRHYVQIALDRNLLWECMEWDEKHGQTKEQIAAFNLLFPNLLYEVDYEKRFMYHVIIKGKVYYKTNNKAAAETYVGYYGGKIEKQF